MGNEGQLSPARYRIDPQRVVHETIDGETIVIDLETGTYFSLTGSGAEIWRLLLHAWTADEIAEAFTGGDLQSVETVASGLLDAGVLIADPTLDRAPAAAPSTAWEPAVFETYTDMEYFLLLDPVHDVPAAGWPHAKAEDPEPVGDVELVD